MIRAALSRHRSILLYGVALALLLFLLKWLQFKLLIIDHAFELYAGSIAVLFTGLGIWLALKLARPKVQTLVVEVPVAQEPEIDEAGIRKLGLSKRELEVLQLMAAGHSNQEIAAELFLSLNTVKTHSSRVFEKLEVSRRTQAVEKAKRLMLIQ